MIAALNPVVGGGGGMPHRDGTNGSGADAAYLKNTPIEITEAEVPVRFLRYGLQPDTGGAGRQRGGLATVMEFTLFAPEQPGHRPQPRPLALPPLGHPGRRAGRALEPRRQSRHGAGDACSATATSSPLEPGDVLHIHSPGGGGRGHPLERDPERGARSMSRAATSRRGGRRRDYGVVLRDGRSGRGRNERAARRAAADRHDGHFHFGPEREGFEAVWTPDAYDGLTAILAALPVHWRFFVKTKLFAAVADLTARGEAPDIGRAMAAVRRDFPQVPCA